LKLIQTRDPALAGYVPVMIAADFAKGLLQGDGSLAVAAAASSRREAQQWPRRKQGLPSANLFTSSRHTPPVWGVCGERHPTDTGLPS
jgi:hypothetical protein